MQNEKLVLKIYPPMDFERSIYIQGKLHKLDITRKNTKNTILEQVHQFIPKFDN